MALVLSPAPGHQVRDARIFRKPIAAGTEPTSDIISLDGDGWLTVDGLVGWAGRDTDVARLEVVTADGRALGVAVRDADYVSIPCSAPSSFTPERLPPSRPCLLRVPPRVPS